MKNARRTPVRMSPFHQQRTTGNFEETVGLAKRLGVEPPFLPGSCARAGRRRAAQHPDLGRDTEQHFARARWHTQGYKSPEVKRESAKRLGPKKAASCSPPEEM